MKFFLLTLSLMASTFCSIGQTVYYLEMNNVRAAVSDFGHFFNNSSTNMPGYEVPIGSGNHAIYYMNPWMVAIDDTGSLHAACHNYSSPELFPGPVADNYTDSEYVSTYAESIWSLTKNDILYHLTSFSGSGYTPIPAIANWPGNGNTSLGISSQLAPYADLDNDQIYEPLDGEYPYIQGDAAVYLIMNDMAGPHITTGTEPIGIEVHFMFSQFSTLDAANNTTFMNTKVINRGLNDYDNFQFGIFTDFDLGHYNDDFIGCDSVGNMMYVYNAYNNDPGGSGQPGYGDDPPAVGVKFLNENIYAALSFNNSGAANGDPLTGADFFNYMRAVWKNGQHVRYGGNGFNIDTTSTETNFMYTGNPNSGSGWSEVSAGNVGSDRRMVMSTTPGSLNSGESVCYDAAFIYSRIGDHLENAENLLSVGDFIQDFYDDHIQPCDAIVLENEGADVPDLHLTLHPNPSEGPLCVSVETRGLLELLDCNGKLVWSKELEAGLNHFTAPVKSGNYIARIVVENQVHFNRLVIE